MLGYQPVRLGPVQLRQRYALGAEELIELGRSSRPSPRRMGAPNTGLPTVQTVTISADEARLMLKVVENIVDFSKEYQIEFQSYCPPERWKKALEDVGTWSHEIERQMNTGAGQVTLPADVVFRLIDLEKCITYARDARLSGAKLAFVVSAIASVADFVLGISWLGTLGYITSLAIILGRPLYAKFRPDPQAPFAPALKGAKCLGGDCELIRMKLEEEEKKDPGARQVLERVLVSPDVDIERHAWGTVMPRPDTPPASTCLVKGRFRVRVEGWEGDSVVPQNGWTKDETKECWGSINIAVYAADLDPTRVRDAELNQDSGHGKSYWVEYAGPLTGGKTRRAGPFGCTSDPVEHAKEDAGFREAGQDGGYVLFDQAGDVVEVGA